MITSSNETIFRITGPLCGEVTGEFPSQWPVMQRFDVFFDLRLNKRLSKQSWSWWFEMPSGTLWRHCNDLKRCAPALFISNITVLDERVNCNDQDIFISLAYNIITEDFNIIKSEPKWTKCFPYYHLSTRTTTVSVDGVTWVHVGQKKEQLCGMKFILCFQWLCNHFNISI